jgi:hypothetical protein
MMNIVLPANLHSSENNALLEQCYSIFTNYIDGNKSTARAMLSQIKYARRYYAAVLLLQLAEEANETDAVLALIASVTS